MKPANYAPVYCAIYPELAEIARKHGYALAVHGSLARDFDLICVPFAFEVSPPYVVVCEIEREFAIKQVGDFEIKPHCRRAYTMSIGHGECRLDLSFMPVLYQKWHNPTEQMPTASDADDEGMVWTLWKPTSKPVLTHFEKVNYEDGLWFPKPKTQIPTPPRYDF